MNKELKYSLRIDEDVMEDVKKMATEEERSINSEIIYLIKQAIKSQENGDKN